MMTYKVVTFSISPNEKGLSVLAAEGWRVLSCERYYMVLVKRGEPAA